MRFMYSYPLPVFGQMNVLISPGLMTMFPVVLSIITLSSPLGITFVDDGEVHVIGSCG